MRFDLTDLRLFLHVADSGSITKGAERAHLSLAAASERIRAMEEASGVAVLARDRRGVRPTPAGQALLHHACLLLEQHERMKGELGAYARGVKAHIRLLCNTAAISEFLPDALGPFLVAHPNVNIDLEERPSYRIVQDVAQGLADLGIVADTIDPGDLQTFPFRTDRLVVVAPRRDALARRRQVPLRDIAEKDFVGLSAGSALQEHLGQHAARLGRPLKLRVRVRDFEAICALAAQGVGLGIVPAEAARRCRRTMAIASVPLSDPWALRHLRLCVRELSALSKHAQQLVAHLRTG